MKLLAVLVLLGLVGCASRTPPVKPVPYEQLKLIRYNNYKDCANIDGHIKMLEDQLKIRGMYSVDPETLNEPDRMYNATARILIWNLRIDCNNRDRFSKR